MRDKSSGAAPATGSMALTCACCGAAFTAPIPKYCSIDCYLDTIRRPQSEERCVICGGPITGRPSSRRVDGQRFYCSPACYRKRPPRPVPVLFYARVDLNGDGPCHRWTGACDPRSGHGRFNTAGSTTLAHRVAYALWHGEPVPPVLHHRCEHPWCVNPEHLQAFPNQSAHRRHHDTLRA